MNSKAASTPFISKNQNSSGAFSYCNSSFPPSFLHPVFQSSTQQILFRNCE